jgi:hypothetical protein
VEIETSSQEMCMSIQSNTHRSSIPILRPADKRDLFLKHKNMLSIKAIQTIIMKEENIVLSQDEVLQRILDFYGRFVPYKEYMTQRK